MAIFAIIRQPTSAEKAARLLKMVDAHHPGRFTLDGDVGWLVKAPTSAQNVSETLGLNGAEDSPPGLVFEIVSYWGRANPNTWTWLKENLEAARNG